MEEFKPQIGPSSIAYIKKFLETRANGGSSIRILEWGAGGSTVYFAKWLHSNNTPFKWIAIEYDPVWYEKIRDRLAGDTDVFIVLFKADGNPRSRNVPMNEYVGYPKTLGDKFDLIIVDGRKRRRCLLEAYDLIKKDGIVLLHDAWRSRYHSAFKMYPDSRFLDKSLWRGTLRVPSEMAQIKNTLLNSYFIVKGHVRQLKKRVLARIH